MADVLLNKILNIEVDIDTLLKWILRVQDEDLAAILEFDCSQEEFVSHFLNFVHEKASSLDNENEDLPLRTSTPKCLEKNCSFDVPVQEGSRTKKWQSLFPEKQNISCNGNIDQQKKPLRCYVDGKVQSPSLANTSIKNYKSPTHVRNNVSFVNPISPLHSHTNGFTRKDLYSPRSNERNTNFSLGDFIIQTKASGKKRSQKTFSEASSKNLKEGNSKIQQKSRRINPTTLSKKTETGLQKSENTFNFKDEVEVEVKAESIDEQRNVLLEESMTIFTKTNSINQRHVSLMKTPSKISKDIKYEISADPNRVTHKVQLDVVERIYSLLLQHNFVLNLTSELCFLFSLLSLKLHQTNKDSSFGFLEEKQDNSDPYKLFSNVHNCIYFSTKVLENNQNLLYILDRPSLKLLLENKNFALFSKSLYDTTVAMYESKIEKNIEILSSNVDFNVCFISDTDNRENFPSDSAFHAFKKQRDVFYEILRIWESNHLLSGWNFGVSLGGKIKFLLNLHNDPSNFVHFSRLFKTQLIKNCTGNWQEDDEYEKNSSILSSFPGISSEKISLLKNRIATKQINVGINTAPIFSGYQEFYKDFLVTANNHNFYCHLRDALVSDILELNEKKFTECDFELNENWSNCSLKRSFVVCLKSLRVLAKFLGFLESLPYNSELSISDKVLKSQIFLRSRILPNLDLKLILRQAIERKSLVLTIPWVTKYISMFDPVRLRLQPLVQVYEILFSIYHANSLDSFTKTSNFKYNKLDTIEFEQTKRNLYGIILVKLCLGWLFELPNFPEGIYYNWCFKKALKIKGDYLKLPEDNVKCNVVSKMNVDDLGIIDQSILRICCPYLGEIRNLLSSCTGTSKPGSRIKHITPVTALSSPTEIAKRKLQFQMEEAFFNGQPSSVRKTVEFVSERIASACVKQICYEMVPNFRKKAVEELKAVLNPCYNRSIEESDKDLEESDLDVEEKERFREENDEKIQAVLKSKSNEFALTKLKELKAAIESVMDKQISDRVSTCIDCLLSFDSLPQTKKVCATITTKVCKERVAEWQKSHITLNIFTKDFAALVKSITNKTGERERRDKLTFVVPSTGMHDESSLSPAALIEFLRDFILNAMEKSSDITREDIHKVIQTALETFTKRCDVNKASYQCINQLMVDLVLSLITYLPDLLDKSFLSSEIVNFFKDIDCNTDDLFKSIMCPRNVIFLAQSQKSEKSWKLLAVFVSLLLKERLILCETFETQAVAMYKYSWTDVISKTLSNFYREVVDNYKELGGHAEKFVYLLTFLSDYCADLDDLQSDVSEEC